jgi:protein SCO1
VKALARALAVVTAVLLSASGAPAHDRGAPFENVTGSSVTVKLRDIELLDQDGRRVRFASDVVGDRVVIVDTIYTSCPVVCQILSGVLANLQERLGERLGRDVLLVSISVDPTTDTPSRLKEYARRWKARPGWLFLTGTREHVDEVLKGLNVYAPASADHPSVVLLGDARQGRWRRLYGFPAPERVLAEIDALHASRTDAAAPAARPGRGR